jgi:hypothetical protein
MSATVPIESGVYIASRLKFAPQWRAMRAAGVPLASSWIDQMDEVGGRLAGDDASQAWITNINEASTARGLVLYCEEGNFLKGGLVEVGAALSAGKRVIQVGDCESLRISASGDPLTLTKHPLWGLADSVEEAVAMILGVTHVGQPEGLAGDRGGRGGLPDPVGDSGANTEHTFVG